MVISLFLLSRNAGEDFKFSLTIAFSRKEERFRVLEADLSVIDGQPFIIILWSPTEDKAKEQILSISVWAHLTHIPSVL